MRNIILIPLLLTLNFILKSDGKLINNVKVEPLVEYVYEPTEDDLFFMEYEKKADLYLSRKIFKGTPIKGWMLACSARTFYDSTCVLVPLELALTQAQMESGMGLSGLTPKTNPFNVAIHKNVKFKKTEDGVHAYYKVMVYNYLKCSSVEDVLVNFVNCKGKRYADYEYYEKDLKQQYLFIQRWLDKNY
jgi:hypothetical protein